jgi:putative ATP-dependent endonuclease of OLD family
MSKVQSITIKNFRGIKEFHTTFNTDLVCLIGRGDSGKSTILEALGIALSSNWNMNFFDNDFHNCNTGNPIIIEVTLIDIPKDLLAESKFGLHLKSYNCETNQVFDDVEKADEVAITIQLSVEKDLEPKWNVVTNTEAGSKSIGAADRSKFNAFLIADFMDRHFSWGKGSPLYSLLRQELQIEDDEDVLIEILRGAKKQIDISSFSKFENVINKVKANAENFGINISKSFTTIDYKDFVFKDGKLSLHDDLIPFRLKGKGSKRLISMTIQALIAGIGGLVLIDEIEQGLEPDRVQNLLSVLTKNNQGQVFITTHSRDVLVEVNCDKLYLVRKGIKEPFRFGPVMQGVCRKNPEAFFARKVVVAEGATEIGICRALNEFRIAKGQSNISYLGIRVADGSGSEMIEYLNSFKNAGIPVCLFCDSDVEDEKKNALKNKGIGVFDWDKGDNLEAAVFKGVPFTLIAGVVNIAARFKAAENGSTVEKVMQSFIQAIKSRFPSCADNFSDAVDSDELRSALASVAAKQRWFKSQEKGKVLGRLIFENFDQLEEKTLKTKLIALNNWMDLQ